MIQAAEYCPKCDRLMVYMTIVLTEATDTSMLERVPVCPKCMGPVEIDLRHWGVVITSPPLLEE